MPLFKCGNVNCIQGYILCQRQAHNKLASMTFAFAKGFYAAPVDLHQMPYQCEANPHPPGILPFCILKSGKEVEYAGQHILRYADTVVLHLEHGGSCLLLDRQANMASFRRIPSSIHKQVGHDLHESHAIAPNSYQAPWNDDLQSVPASLNQRAAHLHGIMCNLREIDQGLVARGSIAAPNSAELAKILH